MAVVYSMRSGSTGIRVEETLKEILEPEYVRKDPTLLVLNETRGGRIVIPWNTIAWIREG